MPAEAVIQFIRNYTVEPVAYALQEAAQKLAISVKANFGAYDNLGPEIAALVSATAPPQFVALTIDLDYFAGGIFSPKWDLGQAKSDLNALLGAIEAASASTFFLISTFIPPFTTSLPWAPGHSVLGQDAAAFELNAVVRDFVARHPNRCGLLDFERVAARLGENATVDKRFGLMSKAPFKQPFIEAAAEEILRFLKCHFLPPKKVLVLDCDNTLWGGLVGEVGCDKIQLDPYEYPGIAYYRFQSEILSIAEKGYLICLCSKNDEASVLQVLDEHPHCRIKRNHLAAHRINWADKAHNIKELALELNLGLDSMVFVDDQPAECALIKSQFPEIAVIQVPAKIYELPGILRASHLFDRISVSKEDKERVRYYQAEQGRREVQKRHVDVQSWLRDLNMRANIRAVQAADIPRASQLCQRTNQFNLTTKRYTEPELASFLNSADTKMFLLQAEDRFGSLGLSGLIIYKQNGEAAEVDTFLMSCRIIGRMFDQALFCESLRLVGATWPVKEVRASFKPTPKNNIVSNLWTEYGFSKVPGNNGENYACAISELKVSAPEVIELTKDS